MLRESTKQNPGRQGWVARVALGGTLGCGLLIVVLGVGFHADSAASTPARHSAGRTVPDGTISWLFRHALRGQSLAEAHIPLGSTVGAHWQPVRFARVLSLTRRAVRSLRHSDRTEGRNICVTLVNPNALGGGCAFGKLLDPSARC